MLGVLAAQREMGFADDGGAFGDLFAVLVHFFFVGFFTEIESDFVRVHFFGAAFLVGAELRTLWKIGEALEGDELGGGVVAGGSEIRHGAQNLFVGAGGLFVIG